MNIPEGTILQLGRADSSYPFQNIVATNIQGSDYVDGFPTTSTGTSLGQYFHLGIDGQDNKKTDMLNVSGTYTGGFNFWTSNSTDAPILLADITKDGISIIKSSPVISTTLNDTLIITDFVNTSTLSKTSFSTVGFNGSGSLYQDSVVVQDTQNNRQSIQYAFQAVYQNNLEGKGTSILAPLADDNTCFQSTGTTSNIIMQVDTPRITSTDGTDVSILTATDLTFNAKSILPALSSFNFTINTLPFSFPFVSSGELTTQSSFSITTTSSSITLITPNISADSLISATLYRDYVFSPLGVSLTTNSIVLTGDFSGTQTIYFSGFIFL
jgi:hypothetical protein